MKRKALLSLSAALPIATLALGSAAMAQPAQATAGQLASPAATVRGVARLARPIVVIVIRTATDKSSAAPAATSMEAAPSL